MEIKDKKKFSEIQEWFLKNDKLRLKIKDECYIQTKALVQEYGIETDESIIFAFDENDEPSVLNFSGCTGEPDYCFIQSIVYDKKYHNLTLLYGKEQWEYIKYNDVMITDRMGILETLINVILN